MSQELANLLFSTHTNPGYMPPPDYVAGSIICGPDYPDSWSVTGQLESVNTPFGKPYNVAALAHAIPLDQKPDLLIARVDCKLGNHPANVRALTIPKVAILGDSHHLTKPIETLVNYTFNERYDYFILDHNKQHAHWYFEAGIRNLLWLPALLLANDERPPLQATKKEICFVGQVGKYHPVRVHFIQHLLDQDLPLRVGGMKQSKAYDLYNQARISLNYSLNGDFNLRVFEILAAGGFLITDRLSPLSGLYDVFEEGKDFVDFGSSEEFKDKANFYLQNEKMRNEVALSGHATVNQKFSLAKRWQALESLILKGDIDPVYSVLTDKRIGRYQSLCRTHFFFRVRLYEWVQEQHRKFDHLSIILGDQADGRIGCDLADLPRADIHLQSGMNQANVELVSRCALQYKIRPLVGPDESVSQSGKRIIVCTSAEFDGLYSRFNPAAAIISDCLDLNAEQIGWLKAEAQKRGYQTDESVAGLFYRPADWVQTFRELSL